MIRVIILLLLMGGALAWFARNFARLVKLIRQGRPEDRTGDWGRRIQTVLVHVFGHKRMLDRPDIGLAHMGIFYGFIAVQLCAFEIFGKGFNPHFSYGFLGPLYPVLMFSQDIMCLVVMLGLAYAGYRRLILKPEHVMLTSDAWIIIALTYGVVVTIYILGATEIALGEREGVAGAMIFENMLSRVFNGVGEQTLGTLKEIFLWGHILIILGFLNYLPYSKHLHLLGAVPNIFFSKLGPLGALPTPNLEDENVEVFGASEPAHFTWKHLLDTTACTECGRCTAQCPAQATGKPLSPMKIIHDLKLAMFDSAPSVLAGNGAGGEQKSESAAAEVTPLIRGRTTLDELWACTTCGACVEACPVLIEHVDDIVDMRRNLVLMESDFPEELQRTFTALENEGNPWGVSAGKRGEWAQAAEVKVLQEGESTPLLYWVGCAGACDDRGKKTTAAVVKILKAAGIEFAILGGAETCTGDPARRAGNEYLYQTLARQNIETLNSHKVTKVITQCPHCFNTLANEYPDLGGKFEVMHHSQFIDGLVREGKIKLENGAQSKITFHDPCYLGRWNGVLEEPRSVIDALPGAARVEMERSGRKSFCCGAGGARMWLDETIGTPVNKERTREAIETGADTIAVGCPFCMTMMADGVKDHGKEDEVRVKDIAELVADSILEPAAQSN